MADKTMNVGTTTVSVEVKVTGQVDIKEKSSTDMVSLVYNSNEKCLKFEFND